MRNISRRQVQKLIGKPIFAVRKDGSFVTGELVRIKGNKLALARLRRDRGKRVQTKAFLPLVLFDLLAIGTLPIWGAGFGGGKGYGGGGCCPQNNYNSYSYGNNPYGYGQGFNGY